LARKIASLCVLSLSFQVMGFFQPITAPYFISIIKLWNFARLQCVVKWLTCPSLPSLPSQPGPAGEVAAQSFGAGRAAGVSVRWVVGPAGAGRSTLPCLTVRWGGRLDPLLLVTTCLSCILTDCAVVALTYFYSYHVFKLHHLTAAIQAHVRRTVTGSR